MIHKYIKKNDELIVLLHGTGGNEEDLLYLKDIINPNASVLSLRGNINENGQNRFFKRLKPGVYDEENLIYQTNYIYDFIKTFSFNKITALGYSNGANLLMSILLHYNNPFNNVILLHPVIPIRVNKINDLSKVNVLVTEGENDKLTNLKEIEELKYILLERNANLSIYINKYGHRISEEELKVIKDYYDNLPN